MKITYSAAQQCLIRICGGKASGWLSNLDGTEGSATRIRRMVLLDYQYNTHDAEGIEEFATVLNFISQSITK